MSENKGNTMKKLVRTVALLGSITMVVAGVPAQAASVSPAASHTPIAATSITSVQTGVVAQTLSASHLSPNAMKPGATLTAPARTINRHATVRTAAGLPAVNCVAGVCDLYAQAGTISVPGDPTPMPIWGFSTIPAVTPVMSPTLIVSAGVNLTIKLHNNLPYPAGYTLPQNPTCPNDPTCLSLDLPAVTAPAAATSWPMPDIVGISSGLSTIPSHDSSQTYTLGNLPPGTYLYEAGPTPHAQRQIRMGLAGLLIVRPAAYTTPNPATSLLPWGGAYDGLATGTTTAPFDAEAVVELNEFDPAFNADPFGFDPVDFSPSVYTLNGHAYDPTAPSPGKIDVGPGNVLLLRYANLAEHDRGMTILNLRQRVLAVDSNILRNPTNVATEWMTAGQVADAFVTIDPSLPLGTHLPIFESGFHLNNEASLGLGGAMSYLDVVSGAAGTPAGPHSAVTISIPPLGSAPNFAGSIALTGYTGIQPLTFTSTITPSTGTISAGEWFLDGVGQPGTGNSFTDTTHANCGSAAGGTLNSIVWTCKMSAAQLDALLPPPVDGDHIIWAHGQDANGWGVVSGDVFTFNATGPVVSSLTLHSGPTNGSRLTDASNGASHTHVVNNLKVPCTSADVINSSTTGCTAVGDDKATTDIVLLGTAVTSLSDWVVQGGEYCLVPATQNHTNCPNAPAAESAKLIETPAQTTGATPMYSGPYSGNPSFPDSCVPAPAPSGVNPPAFGAAPGGGSIVSFCSVVPTSQLAGLGEGSYNVYFHAHETPNMPGAAGRWGAYNETAMLTFTIDRSGPKASAAVLDNNPNNGTIFSAGNLNFLDSIQVTATLADTASNIALGEVFLTNASVNPPANPVTPAEYGKGAEMVPQGGQWNAHSMTAYAYVPLAELTAYPEGKVRFWVHGKDIAGNWGTGSDWSYVDLTLDRTAPTITSPAITGGPCCTVTFNATDPVSGGVNSSIVQGEWFTGIDPGQGLGNAFPILANAAGNPPITVSVSFNPHAAGGTQIFFRVKDAAGNWSQTSMVVAP